RTGLAKDRLIGPAATDGGATELGWQLQKGALVGIDDRDVLATPVQLHGRPGADTSASNDEHPHGVRARSSVSTRRHQTGAMELRITYGTVRPASHAPPNRFL